jgi:hypothetical protein
MDMAGFGQKNTLATRRASQLGHNESLATLATVFPSLLYLYKIFVASKKAIKKSANSAK